MYLYLENVIHDKYKTHSPFSLQDLHIFHQQQVSFWMILAGGSSLLQHLQITAQKPNNPSAPVLGFPPNLLEKSACLSSCNAKMIMMLSFKNYFLKKLMENIVVIPKQFFFSPDHLMYKHYMNSKSFSWQKETV